MLKPGFQFVRDTAPAAQRAVFGCQMEGDAKSAHLA
jgi:hypothetical protein